MRSEIWVGLSTILWEETERVCNGSCLVLGSLKSTGLCRGSARLGIPQLFQHSQAPGCRAAQRSPHTASLGLTDWAGLAWAKGSSFGRVPGPAVSGWQQCLPALPVEKDDGIQSGRCRDHGPGRDAGRKAVPGAWVMGLQRACAMLQPSGALCSPQELCAARSTALPGRHAAQGCHQHLPLPPAGWSNGGWRGVPRAGLPGNRPLTQPLAARPAFTAHCRLFSSEDTSKSSCLKPSQCETVCFNSQKPLGFILFCLHLSSETPETQINQQTTFFFFFFLTSFQMKSLSFLYPLLSCNI